MSSFSIGWFGLESAADNIAQIDETDSGVTITGRLAISSSPELDDLKKQLIGLGDQPWLAQPVTFEDLPNLSGWYYVESAAVQFGPASLKVGYWPYNIGLRRCSRSRNPVLESRIVGALRGNAQSHTATLPWQAIPPGGTLEGGPSTLAVPTTVSSADGPVKVYDAGSTGLFDSFVAWRVPPAEAMVGGAKILTGPSDNTTGSSFQYTGGSQSYVVPAGVTKVSVDARGAQGGGSTTGLYSNPGRGARVSCQVNVTPGETLTVLVGGRGLRGSAGYNGGGAPGAGTSLYYVGGGGGGRTQLKRGGTDLVVAGGGGGLGAFENGSSALPSGRGGYNGTQGSSDVKSGGGGSQSGGGFGGNKLPSFEAGLPGVAGTGGRGGNETGAAGLGGGGGGGGVYGGGGGSSWWYFTGVNDQKAGSGGGGSSKGTGLSESFSTGYQEGHGEVLVIPVLEALPVRLATCTGLDSEGSAFGWQIENGMVRMHPVYRADVFQLEVSGWNGSAWTTPVKWQLTDNGVTSTPATATVTGVNVLYNEPERCTLVVSMEAGTKAQALTATVTLRRGSTLVDVMVQSTVGKTYGFGLAASNASGSSVVSGNGGIVQTGTGTSNNRWLITTTATATAQTTGFAGFYRTVNNSRLVVGLGFVTSPADPIPLVNRWFSATSSTVRVVSR